MSVIVPAFNAAAYIRQTLYSVLAQTYRKIEVFAMRLRSFIDSVLTTDANDLRVGSLVRFS